MDDFAHLLLGFTIWKAMKLAGAKAGKWELAAILAASVLPDILWATGAVDYASAHTATPYLLFALPFAFFARARLAAAGFALSSFLHIFVDAFMHARTTALFVPFSSFAINGGFNYWENPSWIAAYWLALLVLLSLVLYAEKKRNGTIRFA